MTPSRFYKRIGYTTLLLCTLLSTPPSFGQKDSISSILEAFTTYQHQNKTGQALETLDKAVQIAEARNDAQQLLDLYHRYAQLFLEEGDPETASFYWNSAARLLKERFYPYGWAQHHYLEAALRYEQGKPYEALELLKKSRELSNNKTLTRHLLLLEARLYIYLKKYKEALKNLQVFTADPNAEESPYLVAKAHLQQTTIHLEQNNVEKAISHTQAALKLAEKYRFYKIAETANAQLSHLYEKQGRYSEALQHRKALEAIKDTLLQPEKAQQEAKTTDKIRFAHQMKEIDKLTAANKALNASKNRSELTAILASAFLIIISLLTISLYRNNQIKLKTNALLHTKNKELKQARDAAVSAVEAKTNFLSTVTHELRTPLYAVTGLTYLLLEENPAEHQKEHLKSLQFSGEYLLNLINDILQINKIGADKRKPLSIAFHLQKVLTDILDSLQQKAQENKTALLLEYDPHIPQPILGDPIKLSQIFMNLVSNAVKFTKNGKVTLTAKLLKKEDAHVTLYFEIKDNGIGISKKRQQHIFDRFEQGSLQINREYGGTGLGLAIVKSLLGLFGSTIHLESDLGQGSTFSFQITLPWNTTAEEKRPKPPPKIFNLKGLHLLVVEDNKINQVITQKMLAKKEMTCDIASNGEEAIALAQTHTYDVILMDIHMPGISGEEATRQIRKFNQEVPIVALTAISLDDSVERFYKAGCNAIITKPFKPEMFYQKIGETLFEKKNKRL